MDDITNRFGALFTKGLENAATEHKYTLIISDLHLTPARESRCIDLLLDQRVEGIIYCGFGAEESRLRKLHAEGLPVVMADKPPVGRGLPSVVIDNGAGTLMALEHLRHLGHQDILFINGQKINRNALLRAAAFREFMERHRLGFREDQVIYGDYTLQHGFSAAVRAVQEGGPYTAIFCGDDMIAFGVLAGLKAKGLRVPEDVAVVGFGDDPISRVFDPSLTTVRYPMEEMGRQAFALFRKMVGHKGMRTQRVLLETCLQIRRSTDRSYSNDLDFDNCQPTAFGNPP
jgi:LacI family transcriptional regulator